MKNYQGIGRRQTWTNGTGNAVASGDVVVLATGATGRIAIAVTDIANGATGEVQTKEVFKLKKATGIAFTNGQLVYWHASNGLTNNTSSAHRAGRVVGAFGSAATEADIDLNQP